MKKLILGMIGIGLLFAVQVYALPDEHTSDCMKCHDMTQWDSPDNTNMLKTTDIIQLCGECHDTATHGKFGTQYATCIECHNHHEMIPLVFEDTCLSCHDDLERKGKHKVGSKCYKCHKHDNGFSRIKK